MKNETPFHPLGMHVLVEMIITDKILAGAISSSILELPERVIDEKIAGETRGIVVEIGPHAFSKWFDGKPWVKPGDMVTLKKYSGINHKHKGKVYRTVEDRDFVDLIDPDKLEK